LYRLEYYFHVLQLFITGNDDRPIKLVVFPFFHDQTDVFGFVHWNTMRVYEYAGVQSILFAAKYHSAVRLLEYLTDMAFYGLEAYGRCFALWVVLFKLDTDTLVKIFKKIIAPLPACPINSRKW